MWEILLVTLYRLSNPVVDEFLDTNTGEIPDVLQEILIFINANYNSNINLNMLSKRFYLSSVYISSMFKKYLGINYVDYLNRIRIHNSLQLLVNTNIKILDVAHRCGYNSSNHYCKIFKKLMGASPKFYRNRMKEKGEHLFSSNSPQIPTINSRF